MATSGRLPHMLSVLLRCMELKFVQRFQQLYFLIHYFCDSNIGKSAHRTPASVRERLIQSKKCCMEIQFTQLNLSGIEHVLVDYHVAESMLSRLKLPHQ
jgi:hypothetical protein